MDKHILDVLVKFGLVTNIGVNADDYKDVDDLIAKGVVTIPGAKSKIEELLGKVSNFEPEVEVVDEAAVVTEVLEDNAPVIDETPETETPLVDTPADKVPLDETPVEEVETVVCDDPAEIEVTVVENVEEVESVKTTKKSKKN